MKEELRCLIRCLLLFLFDFKTCGCVSFLKHFEEIVAHLSVPRERIQRAYSAKVAWRAVVLHF